MGSRDARCWLGFGVVWVACQSGSPQEIVPDVTMRPFAACAQPDDRQEGWYVRETGVARDPVPAYAPHGGAVVIDDWNGDDQLDVMVLHDDSVEVYQATDAGQLELFPSVNPALQGSVGAASADFDADGDADVYITRHAAPNLLLRNDGAGGFEDVAPELGVAGPADGRHGSVAWTDLDRDGDLDLLVAGHGEIPSDGFDADTFGPGEPSLLFLQEGGRFMDASDQLPDALHDAFTFVLTPVDLDADGDLDLYAANDFGRRYIAGQLVWNDEGTFRIDEGAAGLNLPISAMGTGLGDLNHDGRWDLLLPAWGRMALMESTGELWVDASNTRGLVPNRSDDQVVGWGVELVDLDNDADLDAPVVYGFLDSVEGQNPAAQPNALWIQGGDGTWTDEAARYGFDDRGSSRGLGVADLDEDGFLDLVVPVQEGPVLLYRSVCGDGNALDVRLSMPGGNPDAVGAIVRVRAAGAPEQSRVVLAGGTSLYSAGPPRVHVGLGPHERAAELTVEWPDGLHSVLNDVPANHVVMVERP